jgi:hypothetical protein
MLGCRRRHGAKGPGVSIALAGLHNLRQLSDEDLQKIERLIKSERSRRREVAELYRAEARRGVYPRRLTRADHVEIWRREVNK